MGRDKPFPPEFDHALVPRQITTHVPANAPAHGPAVVMPTTPAPIAVAPAPRRVIVAADAVPPSTVEVIKPTTVVLPTSARANTGVVMPHSLSKAPRPPPARIPARPHSFQPNDSLILIQAGKFLLLPALLPWFGDARRMARSRCVCCEFVA